MKTYDIFDSVPMGGLMTLPEQEMEEYLDDLKGVPPRIFGILNDPRTGAFIRGLTKGHQLPVRKSPVVALLVLRVMLGRADLAHLPSMLSTELKLPNDQAQKMAREIEQDLLGPIMPELQAYWSDKRSGRRNIGSKAGPADKTGLPNVLNLKDEGQPPPPPPMPGA